MITWRTVRRCPLWVTAVAHENQIHARDVGDALWLVQAGDPVQNFLPLQIDDAEAIVPKLGHEQALPRMIDG
jgi:hypothetical protein